MSISRTCIMESCLELLNEQGISGLSMRKIADKLQIAAPSLYFHVKDKQELCALISEHISDSILKQISPEDTLFTICNIARTEYRKVKDAPQIFVLTCPETPQRVALINLIFQKLRLLGVPEEYLATSGNLLHNYILSFVTDEQLWAHQEGEAPLSQDASQIVDLDRQFAFGLHVIAAGLEANQAFR